jgi:ribosomal protein L40E
MPDKICVKCGTDVSSMERTKDKSGNYWCRPCYEKALAASKAKKPAAPPPVPNLTEQLIAEASDFQKNVCPVCRNPMPGSAVVCTRCGLNTQTNRQSRTRVEKAAKAKGEGMKAPDMSGIANSPTVILLVGVAIGMLPFLSFASPDLLGVGFLLLILAAVGISIWVIIQGFLTSVTSGVLLIVTKFIPFGSIYEIYFVFWRNENAFLKLIYGGFLIGIIITAVAVGAQILPGSEVLFEN